MTRAFHCILAIGAVLTLSVACTERDPVRPPRSNPPQSPGTPSTPQSTGTESDERTVRLLRVGDSTPIVLTDGSDPVWSPDGARIAFVSARSGFSEIYVMNRDGSGITQLTSDTNLHAQLSWSPDGGRIAWIDDLRMKVMNSDGSDPRLLATGQTGIYSEWDWMLVGAWSPDGQWLAYAGSRDGKIYLARADGAVVRTLTDSSAPFADAGIPTWSPDGGRVAYASWGRIEVVNVQDGALTQVLSDSTRSAGYPAWSPDGNSIAFLDRPDESCPPASCGGAQPFDVLHVMNADGSGRRQFTTGPTGVPRWSTDGRTVLVRISGGLVAVPIDGSAAQLLSRIAGDGALSPDGQWIAYDERR
jgi:TolB protein